MLDFGCLTFCRRTLKVQEKTKSFFPKNEFIRFGFLEISLAMLGRVGVEKSWRSMLKMLEMNFGNHVWEMAGVNKVGFAIFEKGINIFESQ